MPVALDALLGDEARPWPATFGEALEQIDRKAAIEPRDAAADPAQDYIADRLAQAERSANQPTLTLEAIVADPWNAVEMQLPANASQELLISARDAAEHSHAAEHHLMMEARAGRNREHWSEEDYAAGIPQPDAHEYNEGRWLQAETRLGEINEALDNIAGRGVYAEGARPPDAPPITNQQRDIYILTLDNQPSDSVYDVLKDELHNYQENSALPPVAEALHALLPDTGGVSYPWPKTFGEVLEHIERGLTAPDAVEADQSNAATLRAAFDADADADPAQEYIADQLARLDEGPGDEALTPDQMRQRDGEETVKQQDAERPARGDDETLLREVDSPATGYIAERLAESEKAEREGEGQESVTQDHGQGHTPGGGGRGIF